VACEKTPDCDGAQCPWREWCHAYQSGDFTAPDVPTQPSFEGSRRQFRGRIVSVLTEQGALNLDELGPRIRVDYVADSDGEGSREWLAGLLTDLDDDGLVDFDEEAATVTLRR
jgi:A/G-specific adenine glycosylase